MPRLVFLRPRFLRNLCFRSAKALVNIIAMSCWLRFGVLLFLGRLSSIWLAMPQKVFVLLRFFRDLCSFRIAMGHRVKFTARISSEPLIANHVDAPIGMDPFPVVKAPQPNRITGYPDVSGSQVEISVADDTNKLDAVPDVGVRNLHDRCCDFNDWWRDRNDRRRDHHWRNSHDPIWLDDTAGHQYQPACQCDQDT